MSHRLPSLLSLAAAVVLVGAGLPACAADAQPDDEAAAAPSASDAPPESEDEIAVTEEDLTKGLAPACIVRNINNNYCSQVYKGKCIQRATMTMLYNDCTKPFRVKVNIKCGKPDSPCRTLQPGGEMYWESARYCYRRTETC